MPWVLQKSEGGYLVVDDKGKKYSKKPMSKSRALRHMRDLYMQDLRDMHARVTGEKALTLKEVHTGVMVAWKVPALLGELFKALVEKSIGPMYSEKPVDMHMTIAYAGDLSDQTVTRDDVAKAVGEYAKSALEMYGAINGFAVFETTHLEGMRAIVALVDVPGLPDFRQGLVESLENAGVSILRSHGFTAHVTLAYVPKDLWFEPITIPPVDIEIDEISLHWGDSIQTFELADNEPKAKTAEKESLSVFKQAGEWRWVLRSSTAYRDRDGEIVSLKALQNDCDRADADGNYGPLRWWHVPGLDIGDCDFNMVYGKTLIESGTFRYPEAAQAIAKEARNLQVSIGFNHPRSEPDADGVFHTIKRFERSLLPMGRASNPFTAVPAVRKEHEDMTSISDKLKAFATILKDETAVKAILDSVTAEEKAADAKGVEFKEKDEAEKEKAPCKTEDEGMAAEADAAEEETEEGDEEKGFDDGPFVGDLTPDEFGAMMAGVITKAFEPVMQSVKELQSEQAKTKEARASEIASVSNQIRALEARLKELEGATPAAAKGYVASKATDNLVGEDHRLKNAAPSADPAGGFFDFALGK